MSICSQVPRGRCAPRRGAARAAGAAPAGLARPAAAAESGRARSRFVPFPGPAARPSSAGCLYSPLMNAGMLGDAGGQPHDNIQPYLAVNFCTFKER